MKWKPSGRCRRVGMGTGLTEYVLRLGEPWLGTTAMIIDLLVQKTWISILWDRWPLTG